MLFQKYCSFSNIFIFLFFILAGCSSQSNRIETVSVSEDAIVPEIDDMKAETIAPKIDSVEEESALLAKKMHVLLDSKDLHPIVEAYDKKFGANSFFSLVASAGDSEFNRTGIVISPYQAFQDVLLTYKEAWEAARPTLNSLCMAGSSAYCNDVTEFEARRLRIIGCMNAHSQDCLLAAMEYKQVGILGKSRNFAQDACDLGNVAGCEFMRIADQNKRLKTTSAENSVNDSERPCRESFLNAAGMGDLNRVKKELESGRHVNFKGFVGWSFLHCAVAGDQLEVVRYLLSVHPNLEIKDETGRTPLYIAAQNGHWKSAKLLLENGANPNTAEGIGITPLAEAAYRGFVPTVEVLLSNGADINLVSNDGFSAVHEAALGGSIEALEILISQGAMINQKDDYGGTPLDIAIDKKRPAVIEYLQKHGAKRGAELSTT